MIYQKVTNRNIIWEFTSRDFLPTEIIWVHSPLGYREKSDIHIVWEYPTLIKAVTLEELDFRIGIG